MQFSIFTIMERKILSWLLDWKKAKNKEFLLTQKTNVIPIEVKSGNNATVSLNKFLEEFKPPFGIKFITGNLGIANSKVTLPLYMAVFL